MAPVNDQGVRSGAASKVLFGCRRESQILITKLNKYITLFIGRITITDRL